MLFFGEATFTYNGSSQNSRWWNNTNPHFTVQCRDQYFFKTNVYCEIFTHRLVGPFFVMNTMNSERYLEFLND